MKKIVFSIILILILIVVIISVEITDKNKKNSEIFLFNSQFETYKRKNNIWSRCSYNNK